MYKEKPFFITFEGIEGSGKSYQSKKLYNNIKRLKLPVILTREPGGTRSAEKIRKVILDDYFHPEQKEKFETQLISLRKDETEKESGYNVAKSELDLLMSTEQKEQCKLEQLELQHHYSLGP